MTGHGTENVYCQPQIIAGLKETKADVVTVGAHVSLTVAVARDGRVFKWGLPYIKCANLPEFFHPELPAVVTWLQDHFIVDVAQAGEQDVQHLLFVTNEGGGHLCRRPRNAAWCKADAALCRAQL